MTSADSRTPRTDAMVGEHYESHDYVWDVAYECIRADFARGLETELSATIQRAEQAEARLAMVAEQAAKWIPVGERLPEAEGWYAVLVSDPADVGWNTDVWWRAEWYKGEWRSADPVEDEQPVTHWMPIRALSPAGGEEGKAAVVNPAPVIQK